MMTKISLLLLGLGLTSACQKHGADPVPAITPSAQAPVIAPGVSGPPTADARELILGATLVALDNPNQYAVRLNWHEGSVQTENWILQRESAGTTPEVIARLEERVREHTDNLVLAGQFYRYSLWLQRGADTFLHAIASVSVPRDLEVRGELTTAEITRIARLFLVKGSRVRPAQTALIVRVREIISDQGVIESFPSGQTASNTKGRSGPEIRIEAERVIGQLAIVSRGEHGAHGVAGNQGKQAEAGKDGRPAVLARRLSPGYLGMDEAALNRHYESLERSYPACDGIWTRYYACVDPPNNGGDGDNGGTGKKGGAGAPGGKTSRLWINIADPSRLDLRVSQEPGLGGHGGSAGPGGLGGKGGRRGARDKHCLCRPAERDGQDGPNGARGIDGSPGESGTVSPSCVRLGPLTQGDCSSF